MACGNLDLANAEQGDQMGLWKNRPKCRPTHFFAKIAFGNMGLPTSNNQIKTWPE
jgi:hypothetical protein